jgi:zinc D-Ala-D-Ala dipeptidase
VRRRLAFLLPALLIAACTRAQSRGVPGPTRTAPPTASAIPTPARHAPPSGLVDLAPSIRVRLVYATPENFTGSVLPGYLANRGLLRPEAADALARADRSLRTNGYAVLVLDAYRPVRATRAMVGWAKAAGRSDLIGPYIASRSEHNRGTAVDVTLTGADGASLDMGAPFDTFGSGARFANATTEAFANRRLLRDAMGSAGFVPYDTEWWHFSFRVPGAAPLDDDIR